MSKLEFKEWPKIYRFNRDILVTEKIDGTNGCIIIAEDGKGFAVQSRSRIITPLEDNHGFANWAYDHREELLKLGKGYHFGEWWGNGIQRGYGMPDGVKNFSLFNVKRWQGNPDLPACCKVVPLFYEGPMNQNKIETCLVALRDYGSQVVPFMNPEGLVVYHIAANTAFKITLVNDEKRKSDVKKPETTK